MPTENNPENKLQDLKKNVNPEENKKNELIVNLYDEYREIKNVLQYFFKREIQSILDLNITSIESIKDIINNKGTAYANEKLKLLQKFENEVYTYDNSTNAKEYINYSKINEKSIYALLFALFQSTLFVAKCQNIDTSVKYNIWNLIQYITNNNNEDNFYNIVAFISNKSNFFYNLCKCISDAGNLSAMKNPKHMSSWCTGFENECLNQKYFNFCQKCGSNKNDSENEIIKYFSIKFYDNNREIKNNFDTDIPSTIKIVSDFIKEWGLDESI